MKRMKIAIPKERRKHENRVALSPEVVEKLLKQGHDITVQTKAGEASSMTDEAYQEAGARIEKTYEKTVEQADLVIKVQPPCSQDDGEIDELSALPDGCTLLGILAPYVHQNLFPLYQQKKMTCFSLDLAPRITRAQSMDVMSSQSNLGGYRAVIEAANAFNRAFPMMMTAAGTVPPARALILGAGVAGLQAIATAKRLGAIVSAFDVRESAKEQVESLGGRFIAVSAEEPTEDTGGYAKEMGANYKARQSDKIKEALSQHDIVITTALIPGLPAPKLVTKEMIKVMKPGSILVDMAVEAGGNCEVSRLGQIYTTDNGVKIIGYPNLPSRVPRDASSLYARNIKSFLDVAFPEDSQPSEAVYEDDIVKATLLVKSGSVVHENFKKEIQAQRDSEKNERKPS